MSIFVMVRTVYTANVYSNIISVQIALSGVLLVVFIARVHYSTKWRQDYSLAFGTGLGGFEGGRCAVV